MLDVMIEKSKNLLVQLVRIHELGTVDVKKLHQIYKEFLENDKLLHEELSKQNPKKHPIRLPCTINNSEFVNDWTEKNNVHDVITTVDGNQGQFMTLWFDDKNMALKFKLEFKPEDQ